MRVKRLLGKYVRPETGAGGALEADGDVPAKYPAAEKTAVSGDRDNVTVPGVGVDMVDVLVDSHARIPADILPEVLVEKIRKAFTFSNPSWQRPGYHRMEPPPKYLYAYFMDDHGRLCIPAASLRWLMDFLYRQRVGVRISDGTISAPMGREVVFAREMDHSWGEAFRVLSEKRYSIFRAPGGAGRAVACALMVHRGQQTLVVVKRKDQLYRWRDEIVRLTDWSVSDIGLVGDRNLNMDAPVVVGIDRSLYRHWEKITAGQLIVDRCDLANPKIFYRICGGRAFRYILGISRTDRREDSLTGMMTAFCGPVRCHVDEDPGWHVRPFLTVYPVEGVDYTGVDEYMDAVNVLQKSDQRNRRIARDILAEAAAGARVLVVFVRTGHLEAVRAHLADQYENAGVVSGRTRPGVAADIVTRFNQKELRVLMTTTRSVAGVEVDPVDTVIVAAPFKYKDTAANLVHRLKGGGRLVEYRDSHYFLKGSLKRRMDTYRRLNVRCD